MATSCHACRLSALRLFVGNLSTARVVQTPIIRTQLRPSVARFSTFRPTLVLRRGPAIEERRDDEIASVDETSSQHASAESNDPEIPWYLQVEPPRHPTLIHEPPPLPDAPEGTPKLMQPLIKYIGEDLGLDELDLLDLRELDPPAGLGPELVMLIGTARSEKHLHVSAGRLVRWARGRGVSAAADGLLGRNELKVKLRRKARKARLLGHSASTRDADDGISTGWVCVNFGTVGSSATETELVSEEGNVVGFGAEQGGTTIVVQMMVESKRQELNLEKLWNGKLKRSLAQSDAIRGIEAPVDSGNTSSNPTPASIPSGRREYSTVSHLRPQHSEPGGSASEQLRVLLKQTDEASEEALEALFDDQKVKSRLVHRLREYFNTLTQEQAELELTNGEDGRTAVFYRVYERALADRPPQEVWNARLWLKLKIAARGLGHLNDLDGFQELIDSIQLHGVAMTREQYIDLIKAIFAQQGENDGTVRKQAALAMQVVNTMFERGLEVLDNDLIVAVIETLLQTGAYGAEATRLLSIFEQLLRQADLPCPTATQLIRLLDAYADQGKWTRFWDIWRMPPRFRLGRTPQLYTYLFRRFASDHHQARCVDALRKGFNEMAFENPPVIPTGALLAALKDCIRVADPRAESIAETVVVKDLESIKVANQEFVKMFRDLGVGSG